ncbi:MAG: glutamine--fructose-6-phosphate transaminase (isomerizing) [Desulfovibrionales bacterium]
MCGIIGYAGHRPAVPLLVEGLERLEYRGYDSAGLAFIQNKKLNLVRSSGKLCELQRKLDGCNPYMATSGLGHTRWATHGLPSENNAHPHMDTAGQLALVHNGIIENFKPLRELLQDKGHVFRSETDTEVLVHLIAEGRKQKDTMEEAISWALNQVEGSYAIALINLDRPGEIWAARCASPLLFGVGTGENFVASDIPAFLNYTRDVVFLEDFELVHLDAGSWNVLNVRDLSVVEKDPQTVSFSIQAAEKGGHKHFMIKEIMEQPRVIRDCLAGRLLPRENRVVLPELEDMPVPSRLQIVACGTSFHAGLWAKYFLEKWARIPVEVEIASEYRYRDPVFAPGDLVLSISQSGETADTLAGIRLARENKVPVLGLCNVLGSTVARESDRVIYTQAGPEISVASTKAMCSQLTVLLLLGLYWSARKQTVSEERLESVIQEITDLPDILDRELPGMEKQARETARKYSWAASFFFLGRGMNFPLALEGALKLKEISYIHAEGYAAGEMKHGPIALIDPEFPTFFLAPRDEFLLKVDSNMKEVQARGGKILALTNPGASLHVDDSWEIPSAWGPLNTFLILPALQLFAYEMAVYLGKDVDQPRNLAKSVTVE